MIYQPIKNKFIGEKVVIDSPGDIQPAGRDRTKFICKKCRAVLGLVFVKNKFHNLELAFVQGVIIKGDADIKCPVCGTVREWHIGEEAINHLVTRVLNHRSERGAGKG